MACRMLASNWRLDAQPDVGLALEARFALMMHGLRPMAPAAFETGTDMGQVRSSGRHASADCGQI